MTYRIEFAKSAAKSFRKLPKKIRKALTIKIDSLSSVPRPQGSEKLEGGEDLHRIRQGDYRVIYQIKDRVLLVLVVKVGHRREIYRDI
jgi:mRNA interferase RelE/StbE